ncbi:MAG: DUF1292 domain-containing protein [Lachnospiraceae bacterium]|nr:DUF1292 domain-containing protein [Lachnospiraceae bacterium]
MEKKYREPDEEMTVTIETDDGEVVECAVLTILEVNGRDYIALMRLDEYERLDNLPDDVSDEELDEFDGVWFYRYSENPDDPNEEPEIAMIEDDDELDAVIDVYDEFLDDIEFEES